MYAKNAACRFAIYLLKQLYAKKLSNACNHWRLISRVKEKIVNKPRFQKNLSLQLSHNKSINWKLCNDSTVNRPSSTKPDSSNELIDNFGERLHRKAKEIEKRKEETRKSLEPEYSFTPKLSSGTEKWLVSKSKKDLKLKNEEVAVVSGNCILQYTNFTPNVKKFMENRVFAMKNTENTKKYEKSRIYKRKPWPSESSDCKIRKDSENIDCNNT